MSQPANSAAVTGAAPGVAPGFTPGAASASAPVAKPKSHHPSDIVAAMCGSKALVLGGFGATPMPGSWLHPAAAFIQATGDADDGAVAAAQSRRATARMNLATAAIASAACLLLGLWIGQRESVQSEAMRLNERAATQTAGFWVTKSLAADGVLILLDSQPVFFRIGQTLPNGETLLAVDLSTMSYRTNRSSVAFRSVQPGASTALAPQASSPAPASAVQVEPVSIPASGPQ